MLQLGLKRQLGGWQLPSQVQNGHRIHAKAQTTHGSSCCSWFACRWKLWTLANKTDDQMKYGQAEMVDWSVTQYKVTSLTSPNRSMTGAFRYSATLCNAYIVTWLHRDKHIKYMLINLGMALNTNTRTGQPCTVWIELQCLLLLGDNAKIGSSKNSGWYLRAAWESCPSNYTWSERDVFD